MRLLWVAGALLGPGCTWGAHELTADTAGPTETDGEETQETSCVAYEWCGDDGNVWRDECGEEAVVEECIDVGCDESSGGEASCCLAQGDRACFGDEIHEVDSCGNPLAFQQSCEDACYDGACVQSTCALYARVDGPTCEGDELWYVTLDTTFFLERGAAATRLYTIELGQARTVRCDAETFEDGSYTFDCRHPDFTYVCLGADITFVYAC